MPKTEEQELELLKANSPYALPDDPSKSGWSTSQIKKKFVEGLFLLYDFFKESRTGLNTSMTDLDTKVQAYNKIIDDIINGTAGIKADIDIDGNAIKTTYAKLANLLNGSVAVLKYIKQDGVTKENIYQIELDLENLERQFLALKNDFDKLDFIASAGTAEKANKDNLGNVISSFYAKASDLLSNTNNITRIINGTTVVDKAYKDQNGNRIDLTYVKIADATNVITNVQWVVNGDNGSIVLTTRGGSSITRQIGLATSQNAGLMSPSDVATLVDLAQRLEAVESDTIRLLYQDRRNPTASQILEFVQGCGYTDSTKYYGIEITVEATKHVWAWFGNLNAFKDIGIKTPLTFTNLVEGSIKGSNELGKVYAESDGTGSMVGYDKINNNFAPQYSNSSTYSVGDLVVYQGDLYKCITEITTAEVFDSTKWYQINIKALLEEKENTFNSNHKLDSDYVNDSNSTNKFVTSNDKQVWTAKYDKPSTGIPKTDLDSSVQASLGKADTALQEHQDISGKVDKVSGKGLSTNDYTTAEKNKVAEIDNKANRTELPSKTSDLQNDSNFITNSNAQIAESQVTNLPTDLQNIREVAEGKTKTYVIAAQSDITGTKNSDDEYTNVTAITGVTIANLKVGDNVLIKALQVPDYWVSQLNQSGGVTTSVSLNKLETTKVIVPTVNNATLTIQKNGVTIATFTANSSTDTIANFTVPTKTSDLQNDSGFTTFSGNASDLVEDSTHRLVTDTDKTNWNNKLSSITKKMVTDALGYTPPQQDTTYSQATSSALGLVKIGATTSGKSYPVKLNSSGQMYVDVPWENTDTNTWRPLGTGATDACAGNDSRLSDSRPANGGNADTVDGLHASSFFGKSTINVGGAEFGSNQINNANPSGLSGAYKWGTYLSFAQTDSRFEIYAPHTGTDNDHIYARTGWNDDRKNWKALAFTNDIPDVSGKANSSDLGTQVTYSYSNGTLTITTK